MRIQCNIMTNLNIKWARNVYVGARFGVLRAVLGMNTFIFWHAVVGSFGELKCIYRLVPSLSSSGLLAKLFLAPAVLVRDEAGPWANDS